MALSRGDTVGLWSGARREMEGDGWLVARTLRGGTKAMREAREVFTPATAREQRMPDRYNARLRRSVLYPAYDDRVKKVASLPFQKEPTITGDVLPDVVTKIVADADRAGTPMAMFAKGIYTDAIDRGIGFFLVDMVPSAGLTLPQADAIDARPYWCRIAPDNMLGFQTRTIYGREVVTEFRYREWGYRPNKDGIDELVDSVRVWNQSTVQVWERTTGDAVINRDIKAASPGVGGYQMTSEIAHGFPDGIPLVVVYTNKVGMMQARPPMIDLAWLNIAHWNSQSVQGEALHYCRSPILKMSGASQQNAEQPPEVGPGSRIIDTSSELDVSFVEIAGTSLQAGEREIEMLRLQMEALGMRPLVSAGGPTTATGEVRADMAEKSEAQSWVEAMEWALIKGFDLAATWVGETLPEDFNVSLFKDSSLIAGKATDLPFLFSIKDSLTPRTFLSEVKARGVLVTVDDIDQEVADVENEKANSMQRQMDAMAARMVADRNPSDPNADPSADPGSQDANVAPADQPMPGSVGA
jgi:hypothetical protein